MLSQHIQARTQRVASPQVGWLPWAVQARAKGYLVSRESAGGTQREFLKNAVGKPVIFRKLATAEAAWRKANGAQQ